MANIFTRSLLYAVFLLIICCQNIAQAQDNTAQNITDDTYFYGQSPPVYPSPQMSSGGRWAASYAKAVALVNQMTTEEKANITVGYKAKNSCSGNTGAVPRLNFPSLCLADAGNGVLNTDFVNGWPSALHVGASWNRQLSYKRAYQMGGEFRAKGVNVALGPVVGPLGRMPTGGRNWEGFSNDPYLCGQLVAETVQGIQDAGVTTSVKHYIGNEQETNRNPIAGTNISASSSNIDDKTMHELYLWPFADAVSRGAGSIMCSYNRLNNSYGCQNSKSQNGILKTELGFQGWIVSDWSAQHSGLASANAGLDVAMPNSPFWGVNGANLTIAINNGSLAESRLTDMATRVVASWYQMGQDQDFPDTAKGMPVSHLTPHTKVDARNASSKPVLLDGTVEGHVLVKNVNNALPLKKPQMLSIFGYDAPAPPQYEVDTFASHYGVDSILPSQRIVTIFDAAHTYQIAAGGTLTAGGGSGANAPQYISAPFDALQARAYIDDTSLYWDFTSVNPAVDTSSDACLVFINAYATEGFDRPGIYDAYSDSLVQNVAANCSNTIVTIHNAGIRLVDQWIEHPNVTAVIFAHLPGQESGRALVQLLYGDQSFSGKLPYTVAKNESDYDVLYPAQPEGVYGLFPQNNFSEGVYIDYRDFDRKNITPRFEFGFGLSYTTFGYSNLQVVVRNASTCYYPPDTTIIEGGATSLWDVIATIQATVSNTGSVTAAEVAQLYVGIPNGPVRQLRGFEKVNLPAGSNVTVGFDLTRRDLSEWSVVDQSWVLQQSTYQIYVGSSSRDLPLSCSLAIGG